MDLSYVTALQAEKGGFNFDTFNRNSLILKSGGKDSVYSSILSQVKKTGTTICGVVTSKGVVLGADTRATAGDTVVDKNCRKLHRLSDNIWTAGAGGAADLDHTTSLFEGKMDLERLSTGEKNKESVFSVVSVCAGCFCPCRS